MARRASDTTELLQAALNASDAELLDALLEGYRRRPLSQLAELIEIAGKRVAADHPMKGSLNDQHMMWRGVAVLKRSIDVEWLIANVITGRVEYSIERILELETWPVDPRMSAGLLALADGKKMMSRQARPFWKEAFRIITKQVHPALATILTPMLAMQPQTEFDTFLIKKLRVVENRLAKLAPASPSTGEAAVLAKLSARLEVGRHRAAQKTADDFLREIWAAPDDDNLRAVFADWLQERGDPRGEFIALQLARKPSPREKALLAKHREWAAPFEAVISMPNSRFTRGFLSSVHVHWRKLASMPALMTHPAWATVRNYKIDPEGAEACDVWIEHMIALGAKRD